MFMLYFGLLLQAYYVLILIIFLQKHTKCRPIKVSSDMEGILLDSFINVLYLSLHELQNRGARGVWGVQSDIFPLRQTKREKKLAKVALICLVKHCSSKNTARSGFYDGS